MRPIVTIGILCSCLWLVVVVVLLYIHWEAVRLMKLNEIGDFLAGAGSILALIWLVLGFFLQYTELKQNTASLNIQKTELQLAREEAKRQADATAELARHYEKQVTATERLAAIQADSEAREERRKTEEVQPRLIFSGYAKPRYNFVNRGGPADHVRISGPEGVSIRIQPERYIPPGHTGFIEVADSDRVKLPLIFTMEYSDVQNERRRVAIHFKSADEIVQDRSVPV